MNCESCGDEFDGSRCHCGWAAPALEVKKKASDWIIYDCQTPGCRVKIRVRVGQQADHPVCKWCLKEAAYNTRPSIEKQPDDGPLLTKEEFGLELFDAIKANAARLHALKRDDKVGAKFWESALNALLPKITNPDDIRRILAMQ